MNDKFAFARGKQAALSGLFIKRKRRQEKPIVSMVLLTALILGCLVCDLFLIREPSYMDLKNCSVPPCRAFLFGTDTMGRDLFSMIWYGGRISLLIGVMSTLISTVIAVVFGAVSGWVPDWADGILMRLTEILLSVPNLLVVVLVQAILGKANLLSISFVIGITSWMSIAKVIRTQVRQLRCREYVIASKCLGGSFFHILWKHLLPGFVSSIMFMVVMNIRNAIVAESTLSFMGIGLPVEVISWGSMLSLAESALLGNSWWIILVPGLFLVVTLLCFTNVGDYLRKKMNLRQSNI